MSAATWGGFTFGSLAFGAWPAQPAPALAADLQEAACAWLEADAALMGLLAGGLHADEAPHEAGLPYLVVTDPDAELAYDSGGSIEAVRLQLAVFAPGKARARAIRRLAEARLQDAPLQFADGTLLHLRMAGRAGGIDPDPGPGGCDVWQEARLFDAVVER